MAFDYSPLVSTAAALLAQFGQAVTLARTTGGTYDPVAGTKSGATTQTQTASAALFDYSLQESGAKFAGESMVRVGDKKCLIAADGLTWAPDEGTTLTDAAGVVWQLEHITATAPAGTVVVYTANATR
jgi:hypothetical protein